LIAFGVNVRGLHLAKWWSDLHREHAGVGHCEPVGRKQRGSGTSERGRGDRLIVRYVHAVVRICVVRFSIGGIADRLGIRLGALAAFLVSLLALIFEAVPLGDVASPKLFAMKVAGLICATNAAGTFLYWRGIKRLARLAATADAVAT
jgi:hypothetical protein